MTKRAAPKTYSAAQVVKHLRSSTPDYVDEGWVEDILIPDIEAIPKWERITVDPKTTDIAFTFYGKDEDDERMPEIMRGKQRYPAVIAIDGQVIDGNHRMSAALHKRMTIDAFVPATKKNPGSPAPSSRKIGTMIAVLDGADIIVLNAKGKVTHVRGYLTTGAARSHWSDLVTVDDLKKLGTRMTNPGDPSITQISLESPDGYDVITFEKRPNGIRRTHTIDEGGAGPSNRGTHRISIVSKVRANAEVTKLRAAGWKQVTFRARRNPRRHNPPQFVYHGTSSAAANDIRKRGIRMDASTKGYFGEGFYTAEDAALAKSNYADFADEDDGPGVVLKLAVKPRARLLDLRKSADWDRWGSLKIRGRKATDLMSFDGFSKMMVEAGIDGLYDESFGGWVFYNPKVIEVVGNNPRRANPWIAPHTKTVDVYRNLNNGRLSVKNRGLGSKVAGYFDRIELENVELVVSAARLKYMREVKKKRTVVAYARGDVVAVSEDPGRIPTGKGWVEITFNPWMWDTFVTVKEQRPVFGADRAIVVAGRVYAKGPKYKATTGKKRNPGRSDTTTIRLPPDFFVTHAQHRAMLKEAQAEIERRTGARPTLDEVEAIIQKVMEERARQEVAARRARFRVV